MNIKKNNSRLKLLKRLFVSSISSIYYLMVFLFLLWNMCFGFVIGYVLLAVLIASIIFIKKKKFKRTLLVLGLSVFTYLLALPFTLYQYQNNSQAIYQQILDGKELKLHQKLSIYGLNITIGIFAYPFYPEVAKETLYLCIPTKNGERVFYDDFFLGSYKIQSAIKNNQKEVKWNKSEYIYGENESRYALALNSCSLTVLEFATSTQYQVEVEVAYPLEAEAILIKEPLKVTIQEGLFGYLQKIKWLHPYNAIWRCEKQK